MMTTASGAVRGVELDRTHAARVGRLSTDSLHWVWLQLDALNGGWLAPLEWHAQMLS